MKNVKSTTYEKANIFLEAKLRKVANYGYKSSKYITIWKSKKISWQRIYINYGIRYSDNWQLCPIWNVSHNCQRGLLFGFWKLYFEIVYYRAGSFNQERKLFLRQKLWKFYQLIS